MDIFDHPLIYHKINDRTNVISCGEDPALVPVTREWKRTTCAACNKAIRPSVKHFDHGRATKKVWGKKINTQKLRDMKVSAISKSMDKELGVRVRKGIKYDPFWPTRTLGID